MGYQIHWYNEEHRIVRIRLFGQCDTEEIIKIIEEAKNAILVSSTTIHFIVDAHNIESYPQTVEEVAFLLKSGSMSTIGWVLVVSAQKRLRTLARIIIRMRGINFRFFEDEREALRFLMERDERIIAPS